MKTPCYEDHGSPVRRARESARRRLPCAACGSGGEPVLRKARYLSERWHRGPDTYFGCGHCGHRLAPIQGPAASRPSEIAIDRVPDPEGTLRAFMTRDPLAPIRITTSAGGIEPLLLRSIMGPPMSGIALRGGMSIRCPGGDTFVAQLAFTLNGLPWVVWQVIEVDEVTGIPAGVADHALTRLLAVESVEAAFVVAIDPAARWQLRALEPEPGP